MYKLSGNISSISTGDTAYTAFPFIQCIEKAEGDPSSVQGCYKDNLAKIGPSWSVIQECFDKQYDEVQGAAAATTPVHQYVPWVLVDGQLVDNTDLLTTYICKAYTGPKPASCRFAESSKPEVCMNN